MIDAFYISLILQDLIFGIILLIAIPYSALILSTRRFRHQNNIFTVNICSSISSTSVFFITYFTMAYFDIARLYAPRMCLTLLYAFNVASIAIPFSFTTFSIHRFCSIVYYGTPFFKTKQWVIICIAGQWVGQLIISLPFILRQQQVGEDKSFSYSLSSNKSYSPEECIFFYSLIFSSF